MTFSERVASHIKMMRKAIKDTKGDMDESFNPQEFEAFLKALEQQTEYITKHFVNANGQVISKILTDDEIRETKEKIINHLDEQLTLKGKGEWRKYIEVYFDNKFKEFKIGTTATGKNVFDKQTPEGSYSRYCFNFGKICLIDFFEANQNDKFYNFIPNNKNNQKT